MILSLLLRLQFFLSAYKNDQTLKMRGRCIEEFEHEKLGKSLRQRTWRILRNQTLFRRMVLSSQRKYIPRHASRRFSLDSKFAAMKSTLGKSPILKDTSNIVLQTGSFSLDRKYSL